MTALESFVNNCRLSGLILDANVLTLLVVGSVNPDRIATELIGRLEEPHVSSRTAAAHSAYAYLGLTDAAILTVARTLADTSPD